MPVIVATQEAEIRKIKVQRHPGLIVPWDPIPKKKKNSQKRAGEVAQGADPEFESQYHQKGNK
jgi:hypothetical protein